MRASSASARFTATPTSARRSCWMKTCGSKRIRESFSRANSLASKATPNRLPRECWREFMPPPWRAVKSFRPFRALLLSARWFTTSRTPTRKTFNPQTSPSICLSRSKKSYARKSATRRSGIGSCASDRWQRSMHGGVPFRGRQWNFALRSYVVPWYAVPTPERSPMRAISAADAVSLAIQRTREFLFRPFTWGTYLKLGLVAIITEGLGSNLNSSSHHNAPSGHGPMIHSPFDIPPGWVAAIAAVVLLGIVVSIFVFYLITRLRFAYFHCLIHNTKEIRPGWWIYRTQAMRFFWLNLAVGFCFLLVVVLIAIPFATGFWRLFQETRNGGHLDFGLLLSLVLPLIPIILLLALAAVLTNLVLRDCMLPHIALDDASAGEAWSEAWARIMAEKGSFLFTPCCVSRCRSWRLSACSFCL